VLCKDISQVNIPAYLADSIQAAVYFIDILKRPEYIFFEQPGAGRCTGSVQQPQQGAFFMPVYYGAG
jgi:hypothetical protein